MPRPLYSAVEQRIDCIPTWYIGDQLEFGHEGKYFAPSDPVNWTFTSTNQLTKRCWQSRMLHSIPTTKGRPTRKCMANGGDCAMSSKKTCPIQRWNCAVDTCSIFHEARTFLGVCLESITPLTFANLPIDLLITLSTLHNITCLSIAFFKASRFHSKL